jgi:hypothetical protein
MAAPISAAPHSFSLMDNVSSSVVDDELLFRNSHCAGMTGPPLEGDPCPTFLELAPRHRATGITHQLRAPFIRLGATSAAAAAPAPAFSWAGRPYPCGLGSRCFPAPLRGALLKRQLP